MVKHLPVTQETWVQSLGREDPLEKEMATHPSTFAWKTPWMEEQESDMTEQIHWYWCMGRKGICRHETE